MKALIAVDPQHDFCPGGALSVPEGDHVIPLLNQLMNAFPLRVVTQDWHPPEHQSFVTAWEGSQPFEEVQMPYGPQILWPEHCVQGTPGAEFHTDFHSERADLILRKGCHRDIDSYSAFRENDHSTPTGLQAYLRERGIKEVVLAGLAFDFCVLWSARDARKLGFEVVVVEEACRAIDLDGSRDQAKSEMLDLGCRLLTIRECLAELA